MSAAIVGRADLELVELVGPDRERLLHGLTTGEVRRLEPGATTHGFFTTAQGRILADYRLLARPDALWLLLPSSAADAVAAQLEKYKLASQVEIRRHRELPVHELRGEGAAEVSRRTNDGGEIVAFVDPSARAEALFPLPAAPENQSAFEAWLRKAEQESEVRRVESEVLDRVRIEAGELRFGVDFGPENFPQETGREGAVSYTKGCFLGQEVVARIHYRGGVQKRPVGLRFEADEPPPAGADLTLDGRPVGRATSVAVSPAFGPIGLGILHQRGAEPGTRLAHAGGEATVVTLPFEPA
jgi:folate-binding protein YgfZ